MQAFFDEISEKASMSAKSEELKMLDFYFL